jgi:heptosyltransferase-2
MAQVTDNLRPVRKVLFITLSNLGDAFMTLPSLDYLRRTFRDAKMTVVAAPRTRAVFEDHPDIDDLIVFDKKGSLASKIELYYRLKRESFDVIVDLKNTFYGWGLKCARKSPVWVRHYPRGIVHSVHQHLYKTMVAAEGASGISASDVWRQDVRRNPSFMSDEHREHVARLLEERGISRGDDFVLVVPGARSELKKWTTRGYAAVVDEMRRRYGLKVVLAGDKGDAPLIKEIFDEAGAPGVTALVDKTNLGQLAALILRSKLVICNDSGVLHCASYLSRPIVGIFGPSDEKIYGPWSGAGRSLVVRKNVLCAPCGRAHCFSGRACLETIGPYDVLLAVRLLLEGNAAKIKESKYKRILVVRTDRIGDVLLSTPAIKVLRDHFPNSYIAAMVTSYTRELVDKNPCLDEVMVLDKAGRHRGLWATLKLASLIHRKKFDVALILHPTVRTHLLCFLAGIRERIGYDRKAPYFLTTRLSHKKQEGLKHEAAYVLEMLESLGITDASVGPLTMEIPQAAELAVTNALREAGLKNTDRLVVVNPAASCPSKRWSQKKFADLIDRIMKHYPVKVILIADDAHREISEELIAQVHQRPIDMTGRFSLSQLASLLKRSELCVSNDSGPVHLSVAVGTPVISIFSRNQAGLGPRRWGPLGPRDVVLHKQMDCAPCRAHACRNHFECLESITVEEVMLHAGRILNENIKS